MQKILQRWQLSVQAEHSLADELQTLTDYAWDTLLAKALDGSAWMSQFDRYPDAISSSDHVAQQADTAHAAGMSYCVFSNPLQTDNIDYQADAFADCINACDGGFIDAEPYQGFWGPSLNRMLAAYYVSRVRSRIGDKLLAAQIDPRPAAMAALGADAFITNGCSVIAGQHYWNDFYYTPTIALATVELQRARALSDQFGMPSWPTLPGNADISTFPVQLIQSFETLACWRMGTTPPDILTLLGGIQLSQPTPPPTANCEGPLGAIAQIADIYGDDIEAQLAKLRQRYITLDDALGALTEIENALNATRAVREQFVGPRQSAQAARATQPTYNPFGSGGNVGEGANPH